MIMKIKTIIIALVTFWGISLFFMSSSVTSSLLGRFLHVDYSYTGGIVAGDFVDFMKADDTGMIRYTVHQPVTNARWQKNPDYWQLELEYKDDSAAEKNVKIYISLDNFEFSDEKHCWDFVLLLNEAKGNVYNNDGLFLCETENYIMNDGKGIKIRIPLKSKELLRILAASKSFHYLETDFAAEEKSKVNSLEVNMKKS